MIFLLSCILAVVLFFAVRKINVRLYRPVHLWNIALFQMDETDDMLEFDYSKPDFVFTPKQFIRKEYNFVSGYADPFLLVKDGWLYLFYEKELYDGLGTIMAKRTKDFKVWEDLGTVLSESFHLSYPNVFEYNGEMYMVPETCNNNAVTIYKAHDFPYDWKPERTLLTGHAFVDDDLFKRNEYWYLLSYLKDTNGGNKPGLHLYYSSGMLDDYCESQTSPVCSSSSNWQNGGPVFEYQGKLYRPAQKCDRYYGEDVALYEINVLNKDEYEESFVRYMHTYRKGWNEYGGHHFMSVIFNGKRIVVMDGQTKDSWINNRTRKFFKKKIR